MKQSHLSICRSPCCHVQLETDISEQKEDIIWQGNLRCQSCRRLYPIQDGVVYLTILDKHWSKILKEIINRRIIVQKEIEGRVREKSKAEIKKSQDEIVGELMDTLFKEALKEIEFDKKVRVIDIGAGLCETSALFSDEGAEVIATETEIANLQYVSFERMDSNNIESIEIKGKVYHRKNPERYKTYFTRVLCNAERLPFEAGKFDIAFCRSVMHHVQDIGGAIAEMLRVLRKGGKIILCSEPIRSVFDREEAHLCQQIDKIEGMNERRPTIGQYLMPMLGKTRDTTVQYWPMSFMDNTRKVFDFISYDYEKHLHPGEKLRGIRIAKLFPANASINMVAHNRQNKKSVPRWIKSKEQGLDINRLLRIYTYKDLGEEHRDFAPKTDLLLKLRRELLADRKDIGSEFYPAKQSFHNLEKGWLGKAKTEGKWGRYTEEEAVVILKRKKGENNIGISLAKSSSKEIGNFSIKVNGEKLGSASVKGASIKHMEYNIGHIRDPILQIEIENDFSNSTEKIKYYHNEPRKGIWVHCIKIY